MITINMITLRLEHLKNKVPRERGISLIEVLLAIAIFTLFVATLGTIGLSGMLLASDAVERYRAVLVARESIEAVRSMRMENFSQLTPGVHGLSFAGGKWQLTSSPDAAGEITRTVNISSLGAGKLLVDILVEWPARVGGMGKVETQTFVHQIYGSRWMQTTVTDFDGGKLNGVRVGSNGDGAVLLSLRGDWVKPDEFLSYDMPDIGTLSAMAEADGVLYLASSGASAKPFSALDLADAGRGVLTTLGSVDVGATVNAIAVSGSYLYLATNSDTRELVVLKRSDLSLVRTLDLPTNADALSVAATGTALYLGRANGTSFELYEFNIANPEAGIPTVRTANIAGDVFALQRAGSYLYLGTSMNAGEVLVIRTSDLGTANSLDLSGGADVTSLAISASTLYVGRTQSSSQEVAQIDITNPLAPLSTSGGADVAVDVRSLALGSDGRLYAATPLGNSEVVAYQLPSFLSPSIYDITQGAGANVVLPVGPYVYTGLTNNNPELVVLKGGGGEWEIPLLKSSVNLAGTADGMTVAVSGNYAYVGTTANGSGGEFSVINVADPSLPAFVRSVEVGADVNAVALSGPYAYLATSDNNRELIVVNIADPNNPFIVGGYNSTGSLDATAVSVSGTTLVLGTKNNTAGGGRELYLLNVANPALPSLSASFEVGSNVNGLTFLPGGYIGAATANDAKELMVINMNVPGSLTEAGSYNTSGAADARSIVFVNNTHIVLGTDNNGAAPDLFVFAFNALSGSVTFTSSLDLNANNLAVAATSDLVFVGNDLSTGFIVVDLKNPSVPKKIGALLFGGPINGIATDGVYAYLPSADNGREFAIVAPSAVSSLFARRGWFTSSSFDVGSTGITWGSILWTQEGAGTTSLQVRTAATEAGLTNAAWVGEGGLRGGTFVSSGSSSIIPDPLASGLEWIQYRAELGGSGTTTPALTDVSITYN